MMFFVFCLFLGGREGVSVLRKVDFGESLNEFQEVHLESDFVRVVADVKSRNGGFAQSHLLVGHFLIDLKR